MENCKNYFEGRTTMTENKKLQEWVKEMAEMCQPDSIYWVNGSEEENQRLLDEMVASGAAVKLNEEKRPGCYLFSSHPSDVARVEDRTYIASKKKEDAGPTNNWVDPDELKATMRELYKGCMKGRTMYVIPFSMGPIGSPISKIGIELTDSQDFDTIWGIVKSVEESVIRMKHDHGNYCGYVLLISGLGNEILADNSFFCEKHMTEANALSDKLSDI